MNKSSEGVEKAVIEAILCGEMPPESSLPSERSLALRFSVTRPTVRVALQRLARDGWIRVRPRRATVVNDFWAQGRLTVLAALAGGQSRLPLDVVAELLEVRVVLAPEYARRAVEQAPMQVVGCLARTGELNDDPADFARIDWELHITMARASGNRIYTLMLNSFAELYFKMAIPYFSRPECREASRRFYRRLLQAAVSGDAGSTAELSREAMVESLRLWGESVAVQTDDGGQNKESTDASLEWVGKRVR